MKVSAGEVFRQVKASLPRSLVSGSSAEFLERVARKIPGGGATYYLECRLSGSPRVDLEAGYPFPTSIPMLERIEAKVKAPFLLLEWDHANSQADKRPGLLLCLDRRMGIRACDHAVPRLRMPALLAAAETMSRHWLDQPLERCVSDRLGACFENLPRGARLLHLSAMPSRNPPLLKLNIAMPKRAFPGYLRRVGWRGNAGGLARAWKLLRPFFREAKFDLIIQDSIHPKLGLELFPSNASLRGRRAALRVLESRGWIPPEKGRGLSLWHGPRWKVDSRRGRVLRIDRDFGIKIVLDGEGAIECKGYLQIFPQVASLASAHRGFVNTVEQRSSK